MKRYCLALDLKNDPEVIKNYDEWHKKVWPSIIKSITDSGINNMEIYRTGNRLFMVLDASDDFSFETKNEMDMANPEVQKWETMMSEFQQPLPWVKSGEKWLRMEKIFSIADYAD